LLNSLTEDEIATLPSWMQRGAQTTGLSLEDQQDLQQRLSGLEKSFASEQEKRIALENPPQRPGGAEQPGQIAPPPGLLDKRSIEEYYREVEGRDPYSQAAGIREIQEGGEAQRRMLMQEGPGAVDYDRFLPGGWTEQAITAPSAVTGLDPYSVGAVSPIEEQRPYIDAVTPEKIDIAEAQEVLPVTAQLAQAAGGVTPGEFGGASFLGGPEIQDYMNVAGVGAQVAQAQEDYLREQNRLQADQAQAQAWGTRGQLPEELAREAQQRNIAQIRGAGFDRAAEMMQADVGREQEALLQGQRLGTEAGLRGQALEEARYLDDARRAQEAQRLAMEGNLQSGLARQELQQRAFTRQAELGLTAGLAGQEIDVERRRADASRAQEALMQRQALQAEGGIRAQTEASQRAIEQQRLQQSTTVRQAELEAARQAQLAEMGLESGVRTDAAQDAFRQQQLQAAQGLTEAGVLTQGATFGAGGQLAAMGAQQEQAKLRQQAWDYEQWLRRQEGPSEALSFAQSFMPAGMQQQYQRKPSRVGQIAGGLLGAAGMGLNTAAGLGWRPFPGGDTSVTK
jgi:hypothetical protein